MNIFDIHTHIFPEKIADRAVHAIGEFYHLPMEGGGCSRGLLYHGQHIGTRGYAVCSVATSPHQAGHINDFIAAEVAAHPEFVGFATLHPAMADPQAELERVLKLGLKGIKLHPDQQQFYIDDPAAMEIYRLAERYKLPVLLHMGDETRDYSLPIRLARVLERFADLCVIAAHLGGYRHWEEADRYLGGTNVYFDTSSSLAFLPPEKAADLICRHGTHKVLFGTDYPLWHPEEELARFLALPLTPHQQADILWNNAAALLQFTPPEEHKKTAHP
ncbi:MAG: amidohydrolase [Christensenellaceae bacterium]|nr:amidohydrolase [Christensenellaceae bacterium]